MRNDPKLHLDDLADKFATGKDLPSEKEPEPEADKFDRKIAIYVASFIGALLLFFALGLVVLFVRR